MAPERLSDDPAVSALRVYVDGRIALVQQQISYLIEMLHQEQRARVEFERERRATRRYLVTTTIAAMAIIVSGVIGAIALFGGF